jgi:hypothetical protein
MAEGIQTSDGKPVNIDPASSDDIERDFARAMSEPAGDDKAPPKRAERTQEPRKDKPRVTRGSKSPAPSKPAPGLSRESRVEGVKGLVQITAGTCMIASKAVPGQSVALQADAITLASQADPLATACADIAEADERFARRLDRICAAGPYGALIAVGVSVGIQVARNHGVNLPGTRAPEELLEMA